MTSTQDIMSEDLNQDLDNRGIRSPALEQIVEIYWETPEESSLRQRLAEILMCPVCLAVPRHERIFLCHEGHAMCQRCIRNLDICPVCRGQLWLLREEGKMIRARVVEQVLEACRDPKLQ